MKEFQQILTTFDNWLRGNWLLFVLLGVGLSYTIITGGIQIRRFGYIIRKTAWEPVLSKSKESKEAGTISFFQALCMVVASCVGSGNIVGTSTVALAGGMGAIFWMWVTAFVGMATKYGEIILGMLYREKDEEGNYVGGPIYYIEKGLHAPWLAVLCAFFMVTQIIGGSFIQSNTISGVMKENFDVPYLTTGTVLVLIIFVATLGGLKRLAHMVQRLVLTMALIYVVGELLIILANITKVLGVFADISAGAFGLRAMTDGAMGSMLTAIQKGVARGLYSNEVSEGSVPVIHSAAQVNHPVEQGITGVAEVLLDTFVICTITGLVLGVIGVLDSGAPGNVLAINAFVSVWGPLRYAVAVCLLMFSSTTLMSQWYFGFVGLNYIFGTEVADKFEYVFPYFCIIGASAEIGLVWVIQGIAPGPLTIPNLIAMVALAPQVRRATKEYFRREAGGRGWVSVFPPLTHYISRRPLSFLRTGEKKSLPEDMENGIGRAC